MIKNNGDYFFIIIIITLITNDNYCLYEWNRPLLAWPVFQFTLTLVHTLFRHTASLWKLCHAFQHTLSIVKQLNHLHNTVWLLLKTTKTFRKLNLWSIVDKLKNLLFKPKTNLSWLARWKNGNLGKNLKFLFQRVNGNTRANRLFLVSPPPRVSIFYK